jgi:hypothetical protein
VPGHAVARPTSALERTSVRRPRALHLAIAIVTVVGSAVFLLALMVMLVEERRATVGILRLIGFTRQRILVQVFAEGPLIAVAGAAFGVLFALVSQGFFNRFFPSPINGGRSATAGTPIRPRRSYRSSNRSSSGRPRRSPVPT